MKFVSILLASISVSMAADVGLIEEIIAKVNGDIVTIGDLEHTRKQIDAELRQQGLTGARLQQATAGGKAVVGDYQLDHARPMSSMS